MCDTRPIVKDTFAHANTSMILGSCELLGFFIFSVIVLTQKRYIFRHFGIYYLYLGYARIWNTIKIEIIVKWQTRMSLEPHPYPTPEIFFDPIRTRCNLSCSIAYRFQYSNKFKNNHILTALWLDWSYSKKNRWMIDFSFVYLEDLVYIFLRERGFWKKR